MISDFAVGLCPLEKTAFNEGKSDVKFLEYSLYEIPTVASRIKTYSEIVSGKTGFTARNQMDWETHLMRLVRDPDLRLRIGRDATD